MSTAPNSSDALFANLKNLGPVIAPVTSEQPDSAGPDEDKDEDSQATAPQPPSELEMLKNRARLMGIAFSNNIGVESLKGKIQAKLDGEAPKDDPVSNDEATEDGKDVAEVQSSLAASPSVEVAAPARPLTKREVEKNARKKMQLEQMRLIRCRITNLNPSKKNLPGEIFTFANRVLGAVRKFVPYGEATENGYHIPFCIYTQLKEREFLNIKTRKDSRGRTIVETGMAREFAIEVLPQLTERELAQLAAQQAASNGVD